MIFQPMGRHARTTRVELNRWHNMHAPIASLPDEILGMIFEAGMLLEENAWIPRHFGTLVSRVSHHWRNASLANPRIWTRIQFRRCSKKKHIKLQQERWKERARVFLSRSRSLPIEITILEFVKQDFQAWFLQLIGDHIGHCRRLCIKNGDPEGISVVLTYLAKYKAPRLSTIELRVGDDWDDYDVEFRGPIFQSTAPLLTTAELDRILLPSLSFCLPAFIHLTSLRLTGITIEWGMAGEPALSHTTIKNFLEALRSLSHLELDIYSFRSDGHPLKIMLPSLHYFHIQTDDLESLDSTLQIVHAASLSTLSLAPAFWEDDQLFSTIEAGLGSQYPSLRHLILCDISKEAPRLEVVAHHFPDIEQLTCRVASEQLHTYDIEYVLAAINRTVDDSSDEGTDDESAGDENMEDPDNSNSLSGSTCNDGSQTEADDHDEDWTGGSLPLLWPKLHTIGMSADSAHGCPARRRAQRACDNTLDAPTLRSRITQLQLAGHPIHRLKLPAALYTYADADSMATLREIIEMEDFSDGWPTTFVSLRC
ncbi:hypothetical protein HWV62_36521 [Athelia sp. TMB]|nr:hypothetical protein HWV62_36521 [Athelia sp. TMB]